jgi:phage terminase small subunit
VNKLGDRHASDAEIEAGLKALELREEEFCLSFVRHGNAARAARDAGYQGRWSRKIGYEMLQKPRVEKRIEVLRSELLAAANITAKRIVEEMAAIAFLDHRDILVDDDGHIELAPGAPEAALRTIKKVRRKVTFLPQPFSTANPSGEPAKEVLVEYEFWNKDTQLANLAEIRGILGSRRDEDEIKRLATLLGMTPETRDNQVVSILRAARQRKAVADRAAKKQA